jgi:glycosyltransferase involved in cell wall biosynthesis
MRDIRVLHVITEMAVGGAESLVVEMARQGHHENWVSGVASNGGQRVGDLIEGGIPHFDVSAPRRSIRGVLSARSALARAVREFQPDVVVAHNVSATAVARLARPRVPLLTVFHGVSGTDYRNAARVLSFAADRVVAVGDIIAERLKDAGLSGAEMTVIRNAVSRPRPVCRQAARESLNIPANVPVAVCLARMEPQKRHDVLLDAWARLGGQEILLLAGDGSLRADLEFKAHNMGDRIRFLGNRSDVTTLLAAADISVLTSDWEGLPMAVLESLAAGRPVVATDVDGVREVLGMGGGRMVPPGDADSVANALAEMLYVEAARTEAAKTGLSTIEKLYDPREMMKNYGRVVGPMLGRKQLCTQ